MKIIIGILLVFSIIALLVNIFSKKNPDRKGAIKFYAIAVVVLMFFMGFANSCSKNTDSSSSNTSSNTQAEKTKVNKYQDIEDKSKSILDEKDYYSMSDDEKSTINDLVKKWDKLDDDFKNQYNDKKEKYESDKKYDDEYQGVIVANVQEEVKKQLVNPTSASFPWGFDDYHITYVQETDEGMYRYIVTSYVDSKNAFNAKIRNNYVCTMDVSKDLSKYKAAVAFQ